MHGMGAMYVDNDYYPQTGGTQIVEYERTGPVYMHERPIRGTPKMLSDWDPDTKYLDLAASRQAAWHGQHLDAQVSQAASRHPAHQQPRTSFLAPS